MGIAIAGGTGWVGSHVTSIAQERGHETLVLTRQMGVDLESGSGLDLEGIEAVIDVTGTNTMSTKRATTFFRAVAGNLLEAEQQAGVRHHVALSIYGANAAPSGYYAGAGR